MKCSIGPSCLYEPWGLASASPVDINLLPAVLT